MGHFDYALIGNCQSSALVDHRGKIVWFCAPRLDSESVFSSLLGGDGAGCWSILPFVDRYQVTQRYIRNTNVLVTEYHIDNGDQYDVIDFMPRFTYREGYYRAPQIVRILRTRKGNPRVRIAISPRFDYGRITPDLSITGGGVVYRGNGSCLHLHSDIPVTYIVEQQPFELSSDHYCVLSHGVPFERSLKFGCEEYFEKTVSYWQTWVKHCYIPFEYQNEVTRSALALKLHIYEDTGAIIAATTTSLPETAEPGRTWDYRYCWLRDAYFVINVLNKLGQFEEMEKFIQYLRNLSISDEAMEIQPMYGIGGEWKLEEKELPWLEGFQGFGPVRVGNGAYTHPQFDVYGELVLSTAPLFFDVRLDKSDKQRNFESVIRLVNKAIEVFEQKDAGIWEIRTAKQHYLFSKLLCWAAVDRGLRIAEKLGRKEAFLEWEKSRDYMREKIETLGWNEELGYYTQAFNDKNPDASNLLMGPLHFHNSGDTRFHKMVHAYKELLMENGFMFRYRNADDLGLPKHAFTICTFWMVDALVMLGNEAEAKEIFEKVLSCANHVGLLSEDVDPATGELWGNFPQTYSHVGVINSAFNLSKSWTDAF